MHRASGSRQWLKMRSSGRMNNPAGWEKVRKVLDKKGKKW
jgi:hypothetical protein